MELCVVMPVYNESANLVKVVTAWMEAIAVCTESFCFIVVDDGSKDDSLQVLGQLAQRYVQLEVLSKANSGHGRSCRVGYEAACAKGAEWVLQIDSDGQCEAGSFAEFWQGREEYDCVFGCRGSRGDGWQRKMLSLICTQAVGFRTGVRFKDVNVPYRLIRGVVLSEALGKVPEDFDMHNVALSVVLNKYFTLRWKRVQIPFPMRLGGENSLNIPRVIGMGREMLGRIGEL